jgi:hypothetical protein
VAPLFHVLSYFPNLKLFSLHLMTHISLIGSSILETFSAMNATRYLFHIYHLDFPLDEIFFPSNYEKILWNNKFSNYPRIECFFKNKSR